MTTHEKSQAQMEGLATLLVLNDEIRKVSTIREFGFFTTNETHRLIPYHTAYLWKKSPHFKVEIISQSGTPEVDIHAVTNQWLNEKIKDILTLKESSTNHQINLHELLKDAPPSTSIQWEEHFPAYVLWCPLKNKANETTGGLLFFRENPFSPAEIKMIGWLISSYQYTWLSLTKNRHGHYLKWLQSKPIIFGLLLLLFFPIHLSVLGTGTVIAKDPILINAPIDGVIRSFAVAPGQQVKAGDVLFYLDKTDLESDVEVARKELLLTQAKLRTAINQGLDNAQISAEVPILKAQLAIDSARIEYSNGLLNKTTVKSPIDGVVIFNSKEDWIGQPVRTGERILVVTNPHNVELKISLPITNTIDLNVNDDGDFFVYGHLESVPFKLSTLGYNAKLLPSRILAYELSAQFSDPNNAPQLGVQGTARIYGKRVPFIYYLIRRPLQTLRQSFGI